MRTEMDDMKVYHARLASARKAVFIFDLNDGEENAKLRDTELLERSMAGFLLAYPKVDRWEAVYIKDWVVLTVIGTIDSSIVNTYLRREYV